MRPISDMSAWTGELPVVLAAPAADTPTRRVLLRTIAARVLSLAPDNVVISHREGRAPRVEIPLESGLHLSSASRDGMAALAVGPGALGVDIEVVEAGAVLPWHVLHPHECAWLKSLDAGDRETAFAQLWAAKEAYLKALRIGLVREPSRFAALPGATPGVMRIVDPERAGVEVSVSTAWITSGERRFAVALAELAG